MIAKNDEFIYKCENIKYNKSIEVANEEYDSLLDNVLNLENTKVYFVQSFLEKYKKYLSEYVQLINNFISDLDKFSNKDISEQETNALTNLFSKYKKDMTNDNNKLRIPKEEFMSFQHFYEKNENKESLNKKLKSYKKGYINPSLQMKESEFNNLIQEFINSLLLENDIGQENVVIIFELLALLYII